jgi:hypothetical protein
MTVLNMAAYKRDITFKDYSSKLCRKKPATLLTEDIRIYYERKYKILNII